MSSSFIPCSPDCDFPLENLPYGIFSTQSDKIPRMGVAIGDYVLDLKQVSTLGLLTGPLLRDNSHVFQSTCLKKFMSMGRKFWTETRQQLVHLLDKDNPALQSQDLSSRVLTRLSQVEMHLPAEIGDYSDFYSSLHHATNVGAMFRDASNPLPSNWRHLPIGYHGRTSSIVVSGTPIHRPYGQICPKAGEPPVFEASKSMDFELEMALFVGGPTTMLGHPLTMEEAEDRIFGFVLMNDWSARDIQMWECVPLGPFLSKNLGTSLSPWVVTIDALMPFLTENTPQEPQPMPYLRNTRPFNFDINLQVDLISNGSSTTVCKTNFKHLYWNSKQTLVHQTTTGCPVRAGDILGSGTISGPTAESRACMIELSWRGTQPVQLSDGTSREFLHDNDEVVLSGYAKKDSLRIGFGECRGKLLPAISMSERSE